MPLIYCPIDSASDPGMRRVERRAIAWIDRFGFCADERERDRVLAAQGAEFYARFAPSADEERLLAAITWVYWGFAFDDARCDRGDLSDRPAEFVSMAGRLQRCLEVPGPTPVADPYFAALADVGAQLRRQGTPVQLRRFVEAHRAYLFGVGWEVANRARRHLPGLDDYVTMRLHSAGGEPTFALIEIANGLEVPGREMDAPAVRALTEMAIPVAALGNDRHPFRR